MKNPIKYLLVAVLLLCSGCQHIHLGQDYFEHYIVEYTEIDFDHLGTPDIAIHGNMVVVDLRPCLKTYAVQWPSNKENPSAYDKELDDKHQELSVRYGDTGFNRWEDITWLANEVLAYPISINIVSNADYDEQHPAGSSLADIVTIHYVTHKPFVDNNYTHKDSSRSYNDYTGDSCNKRLAEFTLDDSILVEEKYRFVFDHTPTLTSQHELTISILPEGLDTPLTFNTTIDFGANK